MTYGTLAERHARSLRIVAATRDGKTVKEIAAIEHRSLVTIYRALEHAGMEPAKKRCQNK